MDNIKIIKTIGILIMGFVCFGIPIVTHADVLEDLRQQMTAKRKVIDEIEQKINAFKSSIAEQQLQAVTLSGQIHVIDNGVKSLTLEIDKTNAQISELQTESEALKEEMQAVDAQIKNQKEVLREYLRTLQNLDTISSVQAFFKYATLSDAINEIRSVYRAEQNSQITLDRIRELQQTLKSREVTFKDFKRELDGLQARQVSQKNILGQQQEAKSRLLVLTRAQEFEYNKLLSQSMAAQKRQDAEITRLDAAIRLELEKQGYRKLSGVGKLDWPIDPIFGVSCGFHCSGYPYASVIGAHTGTDLPIDVGTPIKASADGYVGKVNISAGSGYSYILLIHGDNISTIYGHVINASVNEGSYVTRGQVIGHTGGAPGARGSGLSTGPHLHFEVRKNGIPVDAQNYLP
ncbi:MAG: peptidoglycan DD-metalloendopeptidase family protein [bacterium]|nr:peptidoglycan DD-metalloendopeptidase family protein [bacterium]